MKKLLVLTLFGWTFAKIYWKKENIIQGHWLKLTVLFIGNNSD